jgi:Domain of unknown function (DUF3846)
VKKENRITAIIVEPNKTPRVEVIDNTLKTFQKLVGGYIEKVSLSPTIDVIINEEGKLIGLEPNFRTKYDVIVGTAVFVSHKGEEFSSLSEDMTEFILSCFDEIDIRSRRKPHGTTN